MSSVDENKNSYNSLTGLFSTMAAKLIKEPDMLQSHRVDRSEVSEVAGAQALPTLGGRTDFVCSERVAGMKKKHNSDNEEEELIEKNLDHICGFLAEMQNRGLEHFSPRVNTKLDLAKLQWDKLVESKLTANRKCDIQEPKVDKSKGAYSKHSQNIKLEAKMLTEKNKKSEKQDLDAVKRETKINNNKVLGKKPTKDDDTLSSSGASESSSSEDLTRDSSVSDLMSLFSISGASDGSSELSSDAKSSRNIKKKGQKSAKVRPKHGKRESGTLADAIRRLDSRKLPAQEKFSESSGESLKHYLEKFEKYCKHNFKGEKIFWIGELQRHLQGRVLLAFESLKDVTDSYHSLRNKLLKWYDDMKDLRKEKNRLTFKNARYTKEESFFLYSSRLENLYRVGYPSHKVSTSKTLSEKFVTSLPKTVRSEFSAELRSFKLRDKVMTWKMIQKMARLQDVEKESRRNENKLSDASDVEVVKNEAIVIQVGQEKLKAAEQEKQGRPITKYQGRIYQAQRFTPKNSYDQNINTNGRQASNFQSSAGLMHQNQEPRYCPNSRNPSIFHNSRYSSQQGKPDNNFRFNQTSVDNNNNNFRFNDQRRFNLQPPADLLNKNVTCSYCHRVGHEIFSCRAKLNQCFRCGSNNHRFRECPTNEQQYRGRDQFKPGHHEGRGFNNDSRRPTSFDRTGQNERDYGNNNANSYRGRFRHNSDPNRHLNF